MLCFTLWQVQTHQVQYSNMKCSWTPYEDRMLLQLVALFGACWIKIRMALPNRSIASIRNRWLRIIEKEEQAANTLPSEVRPVQHMQEGVEEQHGMPLCDLQVKHVGRDSNHTLSHMSSSERPRLLSTLNHVSSLVPDPHGRGGCGGKCECKPTVPFRLYPTLAGPESIL